MRTAYQPAFSARMTSVRKSSPRLRPTLKLPQRDGHAAQVVEAARPTAESPPPVDRRDAANDGLLELLATSLWPMVAAAFRDVDDDVEARFLQLDELQVVISRAPVRERLTRPDAERRVTLEVWPPVGPRLLEVEWSGRRPYVVHRRDGDWLPRLIRASRQFE